MQKLNTGKKMDDEKERLQLKQSQWLDIEKLLENVRIPDMLLESKNSSQLILVLFGVGIYGEIALQYFRKNNVKVFCYCDNEEEKQDKIVDGLRVVTPNELYDLNNPIIVITSKHYTREISQQLGEMKLNHISFDAYFVKTMIVQLKKVYFELLDEIRSEEVFIMILKSMITGEREYCSYVMEDNAFWAIPQFKNTGNEVFIDAGAYVGDTLEQFVWNNIGAFHKIYAFEPGERQYKAMLIRVNRLVNEWAIDKDKIVCVKAGLGEDDSMLTYTNNDKTPLGSTFVSCDNKHNAKVKVYALDKFLEDERITLIKADIEGFEMEMLRGARNSIKKWRPKLAISIYHKPEDLFTIPTFIHSLVPEYKMAIRHHASTLVDTVLYCWI